MKKKPAAEKPMFRVTFSRIDRDETGKQIVGKPREIGAIWQRKNGKRGGILSLDLIPVELSQRNGVLFVLPVDQEGSEIA